MFPSLIIFLAFSIFRRYLKASLLIMVLNFLILLVWKIAWAKRGQFVILLILILVLNVVQMNVIIELYGDSFRRVRVLLQLLKKIVISLLVG